MRTTFGLLARSALVLFLAVTIVGCGGQGKAKVNVSAEIQNLASEVVDTRVNACIALADAGPAASSAVKPLIAALQDKDYLVRRLAAVALRSIGPAAKEAVPALKEAMNTPDRGTITEVSAALQELDSVVRQWSDAAQGRLPVNALSL